MSLFGCAYTPAPLFSDRVRIYPHRTSPTPFPQKPAYHHNHPQHGALPSAAYDNAYIAVGADEGGKYIECGGLLDYKRAFEMHYTAAPMVKLYEDGTILGISMTVENKRSDPMEYLYLCHVNFRPVEGAELVCDADCVTVHPQVDTFEIVSTYDYRTDENGWAWCWQVLTGGTADIVGCRKAELPIGIRWVAHTEHEDAMGMLLPATAEHHGYNYAKKNGQVKLLGGGESITFQVKAGIIEA